MNVTLMEGETISGVIKPKANRYTTTMLRTNPDLEMYIGMASSRPSRRTPAR